MQEVAEIPHEQCRDVTTAPRQDHRHARRFPDERKANDDQSYDKRNTPKHYLSQNAGSIGRGQGTVRAHHAEVQAIDTSPRKGSTMSLASLAVLLVAVALAAVAQLVLKHG